MIHSSTSQLLVIVSLNLITINGQKTINDYECAFEILSDDHSFGANYDGQYFNYNVEEVECVLGTSLAQGATYNVFYSGCNCVRPVVMWNTANGGSVGDGHGRITSPGNPSPGDWEEGEFIAFDGVETACGCQPSQAPTPEPLTIDDFECSFEILSDDHAFGPDHDGRYFNYNVEDVECVLGGPLAQGAIYDVFYSGCNCIRQVVMWNTVNGGSIGDGHGRVDPHGNSNPGDWAQGEVIAFVGIEDGCCTPEPTEQPTAAPTDCCGYSVEEYLDMCYCGNEEAAQYLAPLRNEYYPRNDGSMDYDGYVKIALPVSVFYIACIFIICGVVSIFTKCFNMMRKFMDGDDNVKFSKVVNYSDTE